MTNNVLMHSSANQRVQCASVLLLILFSFFTTPGYTQVAHLGSGATAAQTTSLSGFTVPAGSNRILFVTVSDALATDITGVTFGGTPLVQHAQRTDGMAVDAIYTLSLGTSASSTTGNIVVTSNSGGENSGKYITASVFQRVNQTTPITNVQQANAFGSNSSLSVASNSGDLVIDIFDTFNSFNSGTRTAGGGHTLLYNSGALTLSGGAGYAYYGVSTKPGAASVTMNWSASHEFLIHIAANIQQALVVAPVTLLSFDAQLQSNDASLFWKTTDAVNFSHFEIEKSVDGQNFSAIGRKQSVTATGEVSYTYVDYDASGVANNQDRIYYRLKMVDRDGSYTYSNVRTLTFSATKRLSVNIQSNPFTDRVALNLNLKKEVVMQFNLTDLSGRTILRRQAGMNKGINSYTILGLEALKPGTYILVISDGEETISSKIVKH